MKRALALIRDNGRKKLVEEFKDRHRHIRNGDPALLRQHAHMSPERFDGLNKLDPAASPVFEVTSAKSQERRYDHEQISGVRAQNGVIRAPSLRRLEQFRK